MNDSFPRIITLLRTERKLTQKQAADSLNISQALLSHYERGVRECGLDFLIRIADFYDVSCDYLLGRTSDRNGATITVDDIPEPDSAPDGEEYDTARSTLAVLNKKLIANSLNILFDLINKINNSDLTNQASLYLTVSIYKVFRIIYSSNSDNPKSFFSVSDNFFKGLSDASCSIIESNLTSLANGGRIEGMASLDDKACPNISFDMLKREYPTFFTSLITLIKNAENAINSNSITQK